MATPTQISWDACQKAFNMPAEVVCTGSVISFPMEWFLDTLESISHFRSLVDLTNRKDVWEAGIFGLFNGWHIVMPDFEAERFRGRWSGIFPPDPPVAVV